MSVIVRCEKIKKEYGEQVVLKAINLELLQGEKVGIVGDNGAGKTTFIRLLAGEIEATDGKITWYRDGLKIAYMKQVTDDLTFSSSLSGGEKTKKKLAEVLYSKSDLLILDEPTNHLDAEGIKWFIHEIKAFRGTVLMISHDRYVLDECVGRIIEIERGEALSYKGNYSGYRQEKQKQFESQMHQYLEEQKIKGQIQGQIESLKNWSQKAHRDSAKKAIATGNKFGGKEFNRAKAKRMDQAIKSRIKRLEKMEVKGTLKPQKENQVYFELEDAKKIGVVVVSGKELSKSYGTKLVFEKSDFYIKQGEKMGLYGPNGCGKTTLIKAIMGEEKLEGELKLSTSRKIGYMSQDVLDLDENQKVLEVLAPNDQREEAELRSMLVQMGFNKNDYSKLVKQLNLGGRMKLKLLLLIKQGCDLLILDEPTNHMDLHLREQLEKVLKDYRGTLVLVTHDRYMMTQVCDKLLVFKHKRIKRYEAGLEDYLEHLENENLELNKNQKQKILIENQLAFIIGRLSQLTRGTKDYELLEQTYQSLIKQKLELNCKKL